MSDESIRRHTMNSTPGTAVPPRALAELDRTQALALLGSVEYGRVVFTLHALPAIQPVNHLLDDGQIIIRTRLTAKITEAADTPSDIVVAYQADLIDPLRHEGWSVVVIGIARRITDPQLVARYEQLLHPWIGGVLDTVIGIHPDIVTGYRLDQPH